MRPSADADFSGRALTRITIVGSGTSAPQPETPASGILVETASTALLLDCGQGVIRGLMPIRDPRDLDAIVVGHLHADHYIDLVSLRYLLPWDGFTGRRIPVLLPPSGRRKMTELAAAISEREGFFDHTFEIAEYDPDATIVVGDLTLSFIPGRHYVPAWGCSITDRRGGRIVMSGDTGPNEALVSAATGADLLIVEATLLTATEDDPKRGHLTVEEAIDAGARAKVGRTVLVHHRTQSREAIAAAERASDRVIAGRPGLRLELTRGAARGGDQADGTGVDAAGGRLVSRAARAR
jgi:ribonuclease BN (tRNA processing enzyme)